LDKAEFLDSLNNQNSPQLIDSPDFDYQIVKEENFSNRHMNLIKKLDIRHYEKNSHINRLKNNISNGPNYQNYGYSDQSLKIRQNTCNKNLNEKCLSLEQMTQALQNSIFRKNFDLLNYDYYSMALITNFI